MPLPGSPVSLRGLKPPEEDGSALLIPSLENYGRALDANRALARGARIGGEAMAELAAEARRGALEDALLIHPGIAVKNFVLAARAEALGAAALHITVDSDEFTAAAAPMPTVREGALARVEYLFHEHQPGTTYESAVVETLGALRARLDGAARLMADERLAVPAAAFARWRGGWERVVPSGDSFSARAIQMRRAWEAGALARGYLELPVSRLCAQRPFTAFAAAIARDLPRFVETYNGALARYRKEHKLRYPANPFPDLTRREDGAWEAPFWLATARGRERWFMAADGGRVMTESGAAHPLEDLARGALAVRPKAITLSLYLRLLVCDLFIHGVGGSKYDQITDDIIHRYYGLEPGSYALATGTRWIETARGRDPHKAIAQLAAQKRDREQHPEKFTDATAAELAREKHELARAIAAPGADKKSIGARIGALNALMAQTLAPARRAIEEEITLQRAREPEWAAASARDYPYFLHAPERVAELLTPR
ncbi:MAG: hypothetical protein HY804_08290 [Nitrospinae bacterium]|nr:hypothetical protein [Nitrospinota bacterium]